MKPMKKKRKKRFNLTYDFANKRWLDNGVPVKTNGAHSETSILYEL